MNLKYRGISYQADSSNVQVATMENNPKILKFRGSSYLSNIGNKIQLIKIKSIFNLN